MQNCAERVLSRDASIIGNRNYSPPYESPLEDLFALNLDKYLAADARISPQVEVQTFCGTYRLDFVGASGDGRSVAFECDGTEYHSLDRDEWRDAVILGATNLGAIYRFQGPALFYHMEDCLYLLSRWEPRLFSERGQINLERLTTPTALRAGQCPHFTGELLIYPPRDSSGPFLTKIERHVIEPPKGCVSFLSSALKYARRSGLSNLDEIRARHLEGIGMEEARAEYFQE